MRFIAIIPVCLGLIFSCVAAPSQLSNFQQDSARQLNIDFNESISAPLARDGNPEALRKLYAQSEIKEGPQFNQQFENNSEESLRSNGSAPGSQNIPVPNGRSFDFPNGPAPSPHIAPQANGRSFDFQQLGIATVKDLTGDFNILLLPKESTDVRSSLRGGPQLSAILKGDANFVKSTNGDSNAIPIPKSEANIFRFPKEGCRFCANNLPLPNGNAEFSSLAKHDANSLPLPNGGADFFPLSKAYVDISALFKGNSKILPILKGNADFLPLPRVDANSLPSPKGNANLPPFPKENVDFSSLTKERCRFCANNLPLPKGNAENSLPLPRGSVKFPPFPTGNTDFSPLPLPKSNANLPPFPKENTDFLPLPKGDSNSLPLSKGNANFQPFPTGNVDFSSLPKGGENSLPLPKGSVNFSPFPTGNIDFSSLPKEGCRGNADIFSLSKSDAKLPSLPEGDANFLSFLKGNPDVMASLLKITANPLLLSKDGAGFLSLPKGNDNFLVSLKNNVNLPGLPNSDNLRMAPGAPPQGLPGPAPEQRNAAPLPEQVKDTPEVAAAREAHLRTVAETASKLAEPVKDTPEVMAAREAHLRAAANPEAAIPIETPKYTPEVQAAREAHFRAYALAAKLAMESDLNPKILVQLLGRPGEPNLGPQKIEEIFASLMNSPQFAEELKRLMGMLNLPMNIQVPTMTMEPPKESLPQPTDSRGINNLMEKPQLKGPIKPAEVIIGSGAPQPSASLRIPDGKLSSIDEFEQSKLKAASDLRISTDLKVKDLNNIKPTEERRFIIIRTGELAPVMSTLPLPHTISQSSRWKNWGIHYMSL